MSSSLQSLQLGWNDVIRRKGSPRITTDNEKPKLEVISKEKQREYGRIERIEEQIEKRRKLV